jgi:D-alanyl-D-alanine carboxypeptidase
MTVRRTRRPELLGFEQGRQRRQRPRLSRKAILLIVVLLAVGVAAVWAAVTVAGRLLPLTAGPAAVHAPAPSTLPDGLPGPLWARGSGSPPPPGITSPAAAVVDVDTGQVLWARAAHTHRPIGRLAILATVLASVRSPTQLHRHVVISGDMLGAGGIEIGLVPGQTVTVEDLLAGSLLVGGSDAADSLAVWHSGSVEGFVPAMNRLAKADGLNDTRFADPSGRFVQGTWSSAWDVAALARRVLLRRYLASLVSKQSYGNAVNANSLVFSYPSVTGVMAAPASTGGVAVSMTLGKLHLLAVILGGRHQAAQALRLLHWAVHHDPAG